MKDFFEQCLRDLHQLTGLKQYIEICNLPSKEEARTVFNALVESMVSICNQYPYIPDTEKQKVIKSRMMDTPEFYGLNARFVKLALERVKDIYWKEQSYIETNALNAQGSTGVPFEELPEETQRLYNETMAKLAQGTIQTIDPVNARDLKVIQTEDEQRVKKEAKSTGYNWQDANEKYWAEKTRLRAAIESRGLDKLRGTEGLKSFDIEGIAVWARSKEEAEEIYIEVYI